MGNLIGVIKIAAKKCGISVGEYTLKLANGLKWCTICRCWKERKEFHRDSTRGDGLAAMCRACRSDYVAKPRAEKVRPKRWKDPRDGDIYQAAHRINYLVQRGFIPKPTDLPCAKCGHTGTDVAHQYHHYRRYGADQHETVEALCTKCHARADRRGYRNGRQPLVEPKEA